MLLAVDSFPIPPPHPGNELCPLFPLLLPSEVILTPQAKQSSQGMGVLQMGLKPHFQPSLKQFICLISEPFQGWFKLLLPRDLLCWKMVRLNNIPILIGAVGIRVMLGGASLCF